MLWGQETSSFLVKTRENTAQVRSGVTWPSENTAQVRSGATLGAQKHVKTLHRCAQEPLERSKTLCKHCTGALRSHLSARKHCTGALKSHLGVRKHWKGALRSHVDALRSHVDGRKHCMVRSGATWFENTAHEKRLKELFTKTVSASLTLCNTSLCSLRSENGYSQVHTSIYIYICIISEASPLPPAPQATS